MLAMLKGIGFPDAVGEDDVVSAWITMADNRLAIIATNLNILKILI